MNLIHRYLAATLALVVLSGCQAPSLSSKIKSSQQVDVVQRNRARLEDNNTSSSSLESMAKRGQGSYQKYCYIACPFKSSSNNIEVEHGGILLSYNITTKYADWVAYKLDRKNLSGPTGDRVWKTDPKVPIEVALIPADYKDAYKKCQYDRGHQAALGDFRNSEEQVYTNYLSNITPQKAQLNRGAWYNLEHNIRELAKNNSGSVYIMTGPYYNGKPTCALPYARISNVVPNGYWKIITFVDGNNIYRVGFTFSQDTPKGSDYCKHKTDIEEISKITNLSFRTITQQQSPAPLYEKLGCGR